MIEEGATAPEFDLPGVRDGEIEQISTAEFFGEEIVILAFYPGDFNPACDGDESGLDELDLFTMQKDVTVLAISGDSVHSHLAFADEYNLHMPLLADTDGSVAAEYDVAVDDDTAGYLTKRAVVVVDHEKRVQFAWQTDDVGAVPTAEGVRDAISDIGDEETAQSRYRVGHARYMEGRRAFTSAMKAFKKDEWMMAQTDFTRAADEFDEAGEEFNTAIRFAEAEETRTYFERAEKKAESLWRAADWLSQSANAFASGQGAKADSLRSDAEAPLETARDLHDPPDPDDFPPEEDPAEQETDEPTQKPFVPEEDNGPAASLDADLDTDLEDEPEPASAATDGEGAPETTASSTQGMEPGQPTRAEPLGNQAGAGGTAHQETDDNPDIDDDELEEITAALEEQSESTEELDEPEAGESVVPDAISPPSIEETENTDSASVDDSEKADSELDDAASDTASDATADSETAETADESETLDDEPTTGDEEPVGKEGDEGSTGEDSTGDSIDDKFVGGVDVVEKYIGDVDIQNGDEADEGAATDDTDDVARADDTDDVARADDTDEAAAETTADGGSPEGAEDEEPVALDLTDPPEQEESEETDESSSRGIPDSL